MSFWLHGCCGELEGGPVNQVNHTSWVAVVTPTDRPKSVRNCCLIELFCGVVCVVTLPFWHFCWCRGFCHRTGSDLLLFVFRPTWQQQEAEWFSSPPLKAAHYNTLRDTSTDFLKRVRHSVWQDDTSWCIMPDRTNFVKQVLVLPEQYA